MKNQSNEPTQLSFTDTTSYKHHFSDELNNVLFNFTGGECVMVRKIKDKDHRKITKTAGYCHVNVAKCIEAYGGNSVSGWLLNYNINNINRKIYIWCFHSVWQQLDGKLLDVTTNKAYVGRDKSIFIPDTQRVPDLQKGTSYNNFIVIDDSFFAFNYSKDIKDGTEFSQNKMYWCDHSAKIVMPIQDHCGVYKLVNPEYPENIQSLCDEYRVEIIDNKLHPREDCLYTHTTKKIFFDYSLGSK